MAWRRGTLLFVVLSLSGCLDATPKQVMEKRNPTFTLPYTVPIQDIVSCLEEHFDDFSYGVLNTASYRSSISSDGRVGRFIVNHAAEGNPIGVFEFENQVATLKVANAKPFKRFHRFSYVSEDSQKCIR